MRELRVMILSLAMLPMMLAPATNADSTASDAPTTSPAASGESPKDGLKAYNAAMHAEDTAEMLARIYAPDEGSKRLAAAISRADGYVSKAIKSASKRFGDEAGAKLGKQLGDASDADIDAGTATVTGDRASFRYGADAAGHGTPMILVDGKWKLDATAMIKDAGGAPDRLIDAVSRMGNLAKIVGQEIEAGQFKTIEAVIYRVKTAQGS